MILTVIFVLMIGLQDAIDSKHVIALGSNATWTGDIDFQGAARLDFELAVPDDAVLVRVALDCGDAELELYGQPDAPIRDLDDAHYAVTRLDAPRKLVLDGLGSERVAGATWYFAALWPYTAPPRSGGRRIERASVTMTVDSVAARIDSELEAGQLLRSQLDEASGGFRTFRVRVPEVASALRVDLFDVSSNLDLYARAGAQILAADESVALAENHWGHETLVIDSGSNPPLEAGEWYIDVFDAVGPTRTLPFSILVEFDASVPEELRSLPAIPRPPDESLLAHALLAVVELATEDGVGSGTILSSDGWILTNEHVVGDDDAEIVVSLSLDPTLPPEELLRARLVCADVERDLALLHVVSGLYGQEIPPDYALPTLEIGDPARLSIGDPLWIVGYPETGGTGSRVTINATRGILSGFERADFGVCLKTDAEITNGNSGGAALDEHGLLVGVPSATVENHSGQTGYVQPVTALPPAWLQLMGL